MELKVGDKIRLTGPEWTKGSEYPDTGSIVKVTTGPQGGFATAGTAGVILDANGEPYKGFEFELVDDEPAPEFRVGDYVRLTGPEWEGIGDLEYGRGYQILDTYTEDGRTWGAINGPVSGTWVVDSAPGEGWSGELLRRADEAPEPGSVYPPNLSDFAQKVNDVLTEVGRVLISKNEAYGNSALNPIRVFSRAGATEGINVRIDDKLSRIANGDESEDSVLDLIGYLILKRIGETE